MRAPALILLLLSLIAGCIELPEETPSAAPRDPATGTVMTASETSTEESELCSDAGSLIGEDRFCAERVIRVTGEVAGFRLLDVDLQTFNGDVAVDGGSGDAWGFVATLRARGSTAEEAMARVDDIAFRWAHEDASGHFIEVEARHEGDTDTRSAEIALTIPRAQLIRLTAATSNGDVSSDGASTDGLALTTSNGDVTAIGTASQVSLTTSNGGIDAALTPSASGRWSLTTSNGEIALTVPEAPAHGYSMEGTTSNGEVDFTLRDGEKGPCPQGSEYYTPPCNHRTFETSGFSSRDHEVRVTLTTSNGDINVGAK